MYGSLTVSVYQTTLKKRKKHYKDITPQASLKKQELLSRTNDFA